MDLIEANENNIVELITERNNCLPPIISSLDDIDNCAQLLENVRLCTKYLSTYTVSDVNQELLQHVIPAVKKNLLKVYDDNFLLSDTVEDEFIMKILKENLQVAAGFILFIKALLEFLSQNGEINLYQLNGTPANLIQLLSSTFEHCKNSSDVYKQSFNVELLELFKVTQEAHLLFLKLFELYVVVKGESDNVKEVESLTEVLDIICGMNEILSELNIKSMSDNWKGYASVANKFSSIVIHRIDLKLPISCLCYEVNKNLSRIEYKDELDMKLIAQTVKITSFLIKVALKLCDIFWSCLDRITNEIVNFCCVIYSFPVDLYRSQGHSQEILELIKSLIFKTLEPLLLRLLNDSEHLKIFSVKHLCREEYPFGTLNFLNNVLKILTENQIKIPCINVDGIVNVIFSCVNMCFAEFFWESEPMESFFDRLVVNISASVILYDECYGEVETILLRNLLQGNIFVALLAMEVWTLLLSKSSPQFCSSTLTNLLKKYEEINLGVLTHRPELIYLKNFIQRIFRMLPNNVKNDFVLRNNPVRSMDCWRAIQFESFPVQQRLSIEGVCMTTLEKVEVMGKGNFSFKDITIVAENFEALSTVNFAEIGLDPKNLAKAVLSLWGFNLDAGDMAGNNIFKYFVAELCKITGALGLEFNSRELATVLSQLRILSSNDSYKLPTCDFLSVLSNRPYEYSKDNLKLQTMIIDIICQNLLVAPSNVVKQEALEVIHNFAIKGKQDFVKDILRLSRDMQGDISRYLTRNAFPTKFDNVYFALLGNIPFRHECVKWKNEADFPKSKKMKFDDRPVVEELVVRKKERLVERQVSKWNSFGEIKTKVIPDENKEDGNVGDVIGNIKGEVKCLVNVLKTEKLTAKNASDIRQIANHLLSLL